ncbi:YggT family protein [Kiloniella sp.]|uniref:YggT family protein n=1 Tax=Kiloniella sp. TaxID=1938587 RepID=UPI003A8E1C5E
MDIILGPLITVLVIALDLFKWAVILSAILSWLVAFNVINTHNQFVSMVGEFLWRLTEPVLRPIRNIIPNIGGMDLSPIVLLLIIIFLQNVLINLRISFA